MHVYTFALCYTFQGSENALHNLVIARILQLCEIYTCPLRTYCSLEERTEYGEGEGEGGS